MKIVRLLLLLAVPVLPGCQNAPAADRTSDAVMERPAHALELRFERDAVDSIVVTRTDDDSRLFAIGPNDSGFLAGLLPALAQDRRIRQVEAEAPYWFLWDETRAPVLRDPSNGADIDLAAFGPSGRDLINALTGALPAATEASETS